MRFSHYSQGMFPPQPPCVVSVFYQPKWEQSLELSYVRPLVFGSLGDNIEDWSSSYQNQEPFLRCESHKITFFSRIDIYIIYIPLRIQVCPIRDYTSNQILLFSDGIGTPKHPKGGKSPGFLRVLNSDHVSFCIIPAIGAKVGQNDMWKSSKNGRPHPTRCCWKPGGLHRSVRQRTKLQAWAPRPNIINGVI